MNPAHKSMRIPMPNRMPLHPLDGPASLTTYRAIFGEDNAKAQTWKQQSGSLGHRARLHGTELWLRSGGRSTDGNLADPVGRRAWRYIFRHRRSLRPVHQRGTG